MSEKAEAPSLTIDLNRPVEPAQKPLTGEVMPIQRQSGGLARMIAGGSVSMIGAFIVLVLLEVLIPVDTAKPSYILGTMSGRTEAAQLRAEAAAKAEYDTKLREVEAGFQQKLAVINSNAQMMVAGYQAELSRVSQAYETMYKQALATQQYGMQADVELSRLRAQLAMRSQGGNNFFAATCDFFGNLYAITGNDSMANQAFNCSQVIRNRSADAVTNAGTRGAGAYYESVRDSGNDLAQQEVARDQARREREAAAKARAAQDQRNAAVAEDVLGKY